MSEKIMTVRMKDGKIIYTGSAERTIAERDGLRHLTVIAAPIITDGNDRGKLLVHNRRDKQLAKGNPVRHTATISSAVTVIRPRMIHV